MDIAAGNKLVDMIKPLAKATSRAGNFMSVCEREMQISSLKSEQTYLNDQNQTELFPPICHQVVMLNWGALPGCLT